MPRPPKKPPEPEAGAPAWMATFGDLMSLLLTFFVLIVSMSSIQEAKFMQAIESFRKALSWFEGQPREVRLSLSKPASGADRREQEDPAVPTKDVRPIITADEAIRIAREMQTKISELSIGGQVQVYHNNREVRIYIEDAILFEPGAAELKGAVALDVLEDIVDLIKDIEYPLNIEGYADSRLTTANNEYQSAWELASARALRVLHYLNNRGIESHRLKAVAYGMNMPKGSSTPADKKERNRVEIVIRDTYVE